MKNLFLTFALVLTTVFSFSFASNNSYLILEEDGDNFVMYLQMDEADKFCSIQVESEYMVDGKFETFTMTVEGSDIAQFENNLARIQEITSDMTIVNFNLTTLCENGDRNSYPSVSIDLSDDTKLADAK
jgi:hypothetical protein